MAEAREVDLLFAEGFAVLVVLFVAGGEVPAVYRAVASYEGVDDGNNGGGGALVAPVTDVVEVEDADQQLVVDADAG